MRKLALIALLASCVDDCSCNPKTVLAGAGLDLTFLPWVDGNVFECKISVNLSPIWCPEVAMGATECVREWCLNEEKGGARELSQLVHQVGYGDVVHCYATSRHAGPCTDQCDGDTIIGGCNAFHGCWCSP